MAVTHPRSHARAVAAVTTDLDDLVTLAVLVGVPCRVTSRESRHAGALVANRAAGRLMSVPRHGAGIWIDIGDGSFRSGPVLHITTTADSVAIQLVVRTMEGCYVFDFPPTVLARVAGGSSR